MPSRNKPEEQLPADNELALLTAEHKFSRVIREAARVKAYGTFGVQVELQDGRVVMVHSLVDETTKPTA